MIGYHSGEAVTQESLGEKILRATASEVQVQPERSTKVTSRAQSKVCVFAPVQWAAE